MKRLILAAAAATLMCGATAFAQTDMQPGAAPAPPADSSMQPGAAPAQPGDTGMQPGAMPAPAAGDAGMQPGAAPMAPGGATVVANAPAGDPPSQYPPCKHKGQDRCVAGAGREMAEGHTTKHHHMMKKAKVAKAEAAAPADATAK